MSGMINQYQHNQIATASPEQILLMLYDGAIRFARQAIVAYDAQDMVQMRYGIRRCLAIVTEFSDSLDHKIGGKIAEDLDALYHFMSKELTACNINPDRTKLEGVDKLLVDLRATWGEAVVIKRKEEREAVLTTQPQGQVNSAYGGQQPAGSTQPTYTPLSVAG